MTVEGGGVLEGRWDAETIRRRGVRAVVDSLRLRKEHEQLLFKHRGYMGENGMLRAHVQHLTVLNGVLLHFIREHTGQGAFAQKTGNCWNLRLTSRQTVISVRETTVVGKEIAILV